MNGITPDRINSLLDNEIFVFGSNLGGRHAGGAAFDAANLFGAVEGVGEGLTGNCYAFPTLHADFTKMSKQELQSAAEAFYRCVMAHPGKIFILTKVGCGIAGYSEKEMAVIFSRKLNNLIKPKDW